jgi:hypothetical protein
MCASVYMYIRTCTKDFFPQAPMGFAKRDAGAVDTSTSATAATEVADAGAGSDWSTGAAADLAAGALLLAAGAPVFFAATGLAAIDAHEMGTGATGAASATGARAERGAGTGTGAGAVAGFAVGALLLAAACAFSFFTSTGLAGEAGATGALTGLEAIDAHEMGVEAAAAATGEAV